MSLIDETYFVSDLTIPNTSATEILERLQSFIDNKERTFLQDILGYELWKLLDVELQAEEDDSLSVYSTRFERLVNGYEYTGQDGRLHKWRGLTYTEGSTPKSPIANYVYWYWMKDQTTQTVGLGESATQAQNSMLVSPTIKMISAWNEMSQMIGEMYYYLQSTRDDYAEWVAWNKIGLRQFAPTNQFGI